MEQRVVRGWRVPLLTMLGTHAVLTFLLRALSILGPAFIVRYGWTEAFIGALAAVATAGSLVVMALGTGVLRALGSARSIEVGLVLGAVGILFLIPGTQLMAMVAAILIGLAHAPSNPAGNEILQRYAPPHRHSLVFSIKQTGVPLGGVVGGLLLPVIVETWSLTAALLAAAAMGVAAIPFMLPMKRGLAADLAPSGTWRVAFSLANLVAPARMILSSLELRRLSLAGGLFGIVQSIWFVYFTVYLVLVLGYSLPAAGLLFALMQGASIVGRILLGWCADRLAPPRLVLGLCGIGATVSTAMLGFANIVQSDLFVVAASVAGGVTAAGWNGVQVAEVMKAAPPGRVYEASSGSIIMVGGGISFGPLIFSGILALVGDWTLSLCLISLLTLPAILILRPSAPGAPSARQT